MDIPDHPLRLFVADLALRSALSDSDCDAICDLRFSLRSFLKSAYFVREADVAKSCGVLVSGHAFRHKTTSSGGRQLLSILLPGDALDLQNLHLGVSDHNIQMMTPGVIAIFDRRLLQDLALKRPAIQRAIIVKILTEASMFREWILTMGRRSAEERISHLFCEIAARLNSSGMTSPYAYELPISQEELADATGITPVHVGRILKKMEAAGLVSRNRKSINFSDLDGLRALADFNPRYLHLEERSQV